MSAEYDYLVYCIENYSVAKGISPSQTSKLFEETGAEAYILENFAALHLTGRAYMVEDVDKFIENAQANR